MKVKIVRKTSVRACYKERKKSRKLLTSSSAPAVGKYRNGGVRPLTYWKIFTPAFFHSTLCSCSKGTLCSHFKMTSPPFTAYFGITSSSRSIVAREPENTKENVSEKRSYTISSMLFLFLLVVVAILQTQPIIYVFYLNSFLLHPIQEI